MYKLPKTQPNNNNNVPFNSTFLTRSAAAATYSHRTSFIYDRRRTFSHRWCSLRNRHAISDFVVNANNKAMEIQTNSVRISEETTVLPKRQANYVPLTPLTFLNRAASAYADRTSIVYDGRTFTWLQTFHRCRRLAAALRSLGVLRKHDVVSVLAPNIPAMYELHFAVPMAGAVINTINTRLDHNAVKTILHHSQTKILFVDHTLLQLATNALSSSSSSSSSSFTVTPLVIVIDDILSPTGSLRFGDQHQHQLEYEQLIRTGDPNSDPELEPDDIDEWDPISLNYTSGTTSQPKGVVYSHRGAYLSTLSLLLGWELGNRPVYLWSLPMFHCNGWTFTWGVAARGGTNVCLRNVAASEIYRNIGIHCVTHMCCAPVLLNILLEDHERRPPLTSPVQILTGGAPPPALLLQKIEALGFHVTHAYGLTEATGPALVCEWQPEWTKLLPEEQARLKARQGISILALADVDVKDPVTMESVERDGKTIGEILLRGSSLMKGYFNDEAATEEVFQDGWLRTGDAGVIHPDGYIEIKDRLKDVIISGGENISSLEVEDVLCRHPQVAEAAVVAMPHPRWGESPCAFVTLKINSGGEVKTEEEMMLYCRHNMPRFMVPKKVVIVAELPRSNGKIQKFKLRELATSFHDPENADHESYSSQLNAMITRLSSTL